MLAFNLIVIIIVLIVYNIKYFNKIKQIEKENKELKSLVKVDKISSYKKLEDDNKDKLKLDNRVNKNKVKKKLKYTKEFKDTIILITGAVCIILAAIVFLLSTWNYANNLVKTCVLLMLTLVFGGASYIAKDKYNLKKVSNTFFYITMAYIPICLASISIFGLLGKYLSIYGSGYYIYFFVSSLIVSLIYYFIYSRKNNKILLYGSLLFQVLTIVCFDFIFSQNTIVVGINILLYNLLLIKLLKNKYNKILFNILPLIGIMITLLNLVNSSFLLFILILLISLNYYILCKFYLFNISLMFGIQYLISLFNIDLNKYSLNIAVNIILNLIVVSIIFIIQNNIFKKEEKLKANSISSLLFVIFLFVISEFDLGFQSIFLFALSLCLILNLYLKKYMNLNLARILIPINSVIVGMLIIQNFDLPEIFNILLGFLIFIINELIRKKDKLLYKNNLIVSQIYYGISFILLFLDEGISLIFAILTLLMYIYLYSFRNVETFKYLGYLFSNIVIFKFIEMLNLKEYISYIPVISTSIIILLQYCYKKIINLPNDIYILVSEIISFILLVNSTIRFSFKFNYILVINDLIYLGFILLTIYNNFRLNKNNNYNIVPLFFTIPFIFVNNFIDDINILIEISFVTILTFIAIYKKNIIFKVFSGICLLISFIIFENMYIGIILSILWSSINIIFARSKNEISLFKAILAVSILLLYNNLIYDIKIYKYFAFCILGYLILFIYLIRGILSKFIKNVDNLEYGIMGVIYLITLFNYTSIEDAMIFIALIMIITIFSYYKKYGALFITNMFAIIINILFLTREFWNKIPWWIYLLFIGFAFISFAINNEKNKNKVKSKMGLRKIKEKIDNRK